MRVKEMWKRFFVAWAQALMLGHLASRSEAEPVQAEPEPCSLESKKGLKVGDSVSTYIEGEIIGICLSKVGTFLYVVELFDGTNSNFQVFTCDELEKINKGIP